MTAKQQVEIAILQTNYNSMCKDIQDIKLDIKEIKDFILNSVKENDKRYLKMESVKLFFSIIGATAVVIVSGWQILTWFNSL